MPGNQMKILANYSIKLSCSNTLLYLSTLYTYLAKITNGATPFTYSLQFNLPYLIRLISWMPLSCPHRYVVLSFFKFDLDFWRRKLKLMSYGCGMLFRIMSWQFQLHLFFKSFEISANNLPFLFDGPFIMCPQNFSSQKYDRFTI